MADACWPSVEAHVSLCTPYLYKSVGRILPFLYLGGRVVRILPFLRLGGRMELVYRFPGSVACKLGLWGGVVKWEEVHHHDHSVDPHCRLLVQ